MAPFAVLQVINDLTSDIGFSFQLNANSPAGTEPDAFQQYGFRITQNSIQGFINNWMNSATAIVCDQVNLSSTPINNGLPAGYALGVYLATDAGGNVTGATFQVYDSVGNQLANTFFAVDQAGCNCGPALPCTGFNAGDLSPMTAFSVVLVGPENSLATTFSSGTGGITYGSNGFLTPLSANPPCVETNLVTNESSNATYGALNGCPQPAVTQQFSFAGCAPGLTKCNGTCKDLTSDNENCGSCDNICPANTGCVSGICICPVKCCESDARGNCIHCPGLNEHCN